MAYPATAAMVTFDFTSGNDGGFITSGSSVWDYTGTQWQTTEANNAISFLDSPEFTVDTDGTVNISVSHVYDFEEQSDFFDGGLLQASVNGGFFTNITPDGGYPTASGFVDGCDALNFLPCWSGDSGGLVTDTAQLTGLSAGDTFRIGFAAAWDTIILFPNPNWAITRISIDNVAVPQEIDEVTVPEPSTILALAIVGGSLLLSKQVKKG